MGSRSVFACLFGNLEAGNTSSTTQSESSVDEANENFLMEDSDMISQLKGYIYQMQCAAICYHQPDVQRAGRPPYLTYQFILK